MNISSHALCRPRTLFGGLPLLLAASFVSSCSDIADNISSEPRPETTAPIDSILKFATIEEFETMTASEIPGNYSDYKLNSLRYECVDTIELRALLLDVTAQLTSPTGVKKDVIFKAEVGPELVSVEYVPGGEIAPPHDNMRTAFYPKVERYRNYSDGSRVGPDVFYDYGHPIYVSFKLGAMGGKEAFYCNMNDLWYNHEQDIELEYYKNGVFYFHTSTEYDVNLNTVVIGPNGSSCTGEDFLCNEVLPATSRHPAMDRFSNAIGNYYGNFGGEGLEYRRSILASEEEKEMCNLCRDVPDVSEKPFPQDVKHLPEGWYLGNVIDCGYDYDYFYSNYLHKYSIWGNENYNWAHYDYIYYSEFYLQYLVIDGRIIHFDDLMDGYLGVNVTTKSTVTKNSEGYVIRTEAETNMLYGEKFKTSLEWVFRGVNGPRVVYDLSDYYELNKNDNNEMNNLSETRSNEPTDFSEKRMIPREDGKTFEFDRSLPQSIGNTSRTRTIYHESK